MKNVVLAGLVVGLVLVPFLPRGAQAAPRELREMMLVLEDRVVSVDFKEKPLAEVLGFFSDYTGVSLVISPLLHEERDVEELAVTLRLSGVSVKTALGVILDLKGLAAVYRYGVIMITTPRDARGKPVLRIYEIGDLTMTLRDFPAPDLMLRPSGAEDFGSVGGGVEEGRERAFAEPEFIMDLIVETTGKGTWEDDGVRISVNRRHLVVRTYPTVHREIERLLALLRAYS